MPKALEIKPLDTCPIIYNMSTPVNTGVTGHFVNSPTPSKYEPKGIKTGQFSTFIPLYELQSNDYWNFVRVKPMKVLKKDKKRQHIILKAYATANHKTKQKFYQYNLSGGVLFNERKRQRVRSLITSQSIYYNSVNLWTFTLSPHINDDICTVTNNKKYFYHPQNDYSKSFQYLLNRVKKQIPEFNYVYVAEFQKRGAIHFHLTTPNFIGLDFLLHLWNIQLDKLGHIKSNNCVDISSHIDSKKINPFYLCKYLSKISKNQKYYTSVYGSSRDNSQIASGFSLSKFDKIIPKSFQLSDSKNYVYSQVLTMDQKKLSKYISHYNSLKHQKKDRPQVSIKKAKKIQ